MKLKGVNPIEQHIEKIVLGLVVVIFLGVLAAQFLLQPNMVKVGTAPPVAPARAFHQVKEKAEQVRDVMRRTDIELPVIEGTDIAQQFLARREAPLVPVRTMASLGRAPRIGGGLDVPMPRGTEAIAIPRVQAPTGVVGYSPRGTVDPFEVVRNPALKPLLPPSQPFDLAGVSVEARVDGTAIRTALLGHGADGAKPMPRSWWQDNVEILSVRLEREELTETGEWSNLTEVAPIPGSADLRREIQQVTSTAGLAEIVADAHAVAGDIRRPRYLRQIAGPEWLSPAEAERRRPQVRDPAIEARLRDRENLQRQLDDLRKEREELGGGGGGRDPGSGGGKTGGGGGGGGGGSDPRTQEAIRQLDRRIQALEGRITAIDADLRRRGYEPPAEQTADPITAAERQARPLLETRDIQVWAHDITVKPGKVYRYRISYAINNPAFGRSAGLMAEQQGFAAQPLLFSQHSEWSAPIRVLDDQYYFLSGARPASSLGGIPTAPGATAHIYKFFYGYYRKNTVQLEPGDTIAAAVRLPESSKLLIFDLEARNGQEPGMPDPGEELRKGEPWMQPVIAAIDAFLLDVTAVPGGTGTGSGQRTVAFLRGPEGRIVSRSPDEDTRSDLYRMLEQSVREGETQGEPVVVEPEPTREPPPVRSPRSPREPPPGPGGGGAGGG